jgi:hypothetical protein
MSDKEITKEEEIEEIPRQNDKPRARLGPTEVVILPNSDSEDDDDEDHAHTEGQDGEGEADPDFLKDYPADTEVSDASFPSCPRLVARRGGEC